MAEYIEREKLMGALDVVVSGAKGVAGDSKLTNKVCDILENIRRIAAEIPEADVRPAVKGRWESVGLASLECSECGYVDCEKTYHRYCPDCGAFMR